MKHIRTLAIAFIGLITTAMLMGCSQSSDQKIADAKAEVVESKQEVREAVIDVQEAARREEWLIFKSEAEAKIVANDKDIADYKARMTGADGTRRAQYDKKIDALELKNKELREQLSHYPDRDKNTWEQFKSEFNHDMEELGAALKDFTVNNKK